MDYVTLSCLPLVLAGEWSDWSKSLESLEPLKALGSLDSLESLEPLKPLKVYLAPFDPTDPYRPLEYYSPDGMTPPLRNEGPGRQAGVIGMRCRMYNRRFCHRAGSSCPEWPVRAGPWQGPADWAREARGGS